MKKNYRVTITDGKNTDSFTLLGKSKKVVKDLCDICHIGTGWSVSNIELATKKSKPRKPLVTQLNINPKI